MYAFKFLIAVFPAALLVQGAPAMSKRAGLSEDGTGTQYDQGGAPGACGIVSTDGEMVASLSSAFMGDKQSCGRTIQVTNMGPYQDQSVKGKGNVVTLTVRDLCTGCAAADVDMSAAGWNSLTDDSALSRVTTSWVFVD